MKQHIKEAAIVSAGFWAMSQSQQVVAAIWIAAMVVAGGKALGNTFAKEVK